MADFKTSKNIMLRRGWLRQTPRRFQRLVFDRSEVQEFRTGDAICRVGDSPAGMYGLVDGGLALSVRHGAGAPQICHIALAGSWIGDGSVFTHRPQQLGVSATRATVLLHLPQRAIHVIVGLDPRAWRYFGTVAALHFDNAIGAVDDLLIRDHVKRAIAILLRISGAHESTQNDLPRLEIDVSQQDFATMANIARTTAGTVLRMLQSAGHIAVSYRRVVILKPEALKDILAS